MKKAKSENSILCLAGSTPAARVAPQTPSPELHSAAQPQAAVALSRVYEHLCFISIYFMHLLARCVLRYQKSLRGVIFLGLGTLKTVFI